MAYSCPEIALHDSQMRLDSQKCEACLPPQERLVHLHCAVDDEPIAALVEAMAAKEDDSPVEGTRHAWMGQQQGTLAGHRLQLHLLKSTTPFDPEAGQALKRDMRGFGSLQV